jgi:transglutaminase-like putative cysteine protease
MKIHALTFTRVVTWILDAIAICSLAGVPEIHPAVFFAVLGLGVFRLVVPIRIKDGWLTLLLALISGVSFGSYVTYKVPVVVAMAHGAPIFHGLLWFAAVGTRDLWLRVSVGFVELILLSAMSAEFYLSISIMAFVLLASLMISCSLIRNEARDPTLYLGNPRPDREPDRDAVLPASFLTQGIVRSFIVMLLSLLLFPLLPRKAGMAEFFMPSMRVGYTEDVSITGRKTLSGAGAGDVVMRIFIADPRKDSSKLLTSMYLGLIRARVLSEFDGLKWKPGDRHRFEPYATPIRPRHDTTVYEAIREPLTAVIPVPYAARNVWRYTRTSFSVPDRLSSGEWVDVGASGATIRIQFALEEDDPMLSFGTGPNDEPTDTELEVPPSIDTPRLRKLVEKIIPKGTDVRGKAGRILAYYTGQGFTTTVSEDSMQDAIEDQLRMNSIEKFLFASKRGHCELFATAAAILLRMSGVPTRLVTGFRLSRGPTKTGLTIRSGDAHAWLEYYIPDEGWKALDPTPRSFAPPSFLYMFRDLYEDMSAYWFRYVFNFDTSRDSLFSIKKLNELKVRERFAEAYRGVDSFIEEHRAHLLWMLLGGFAALALAVYLIRRYFPWILSIRGRVREGPWPVKTERVRMERYLKSHLAHDVTLEAAPQHYRTRGDAQGENLYRQWLDAYQEVRFGPRGRGGIEIAELRQRYVAVARRR